MFNRFLHIQAYDFLSSPRHWHGTFQRPLDLLTAVHRWRDREPDVLSPLVTVEFDVILHDLARVVDDEQAEAFDSWGVRTANTGEFPEVDD